MSDISLISPLTGDIKPAWAYEAADILMRKIKNSGLWGTLDFYFEIWLKKYPQYAKDYGEAVKEVRGSRRDKHASFANKSNHMMVAVPPEFMTIVDKFFLDEVKAMGTQKFWRKFGERYPIFKTGEAHL